MVVAALSGLPAATPKRLFVEPGPEPKPVIMPLSEIEKRAILEALAYTKGDHSTAAQLLGIGRTTLYRKLKEYRLEDPESPQPKPVGSASYHVPYHGIGNV